MHTLKSFSDAWFWFLKYHPPVTSFLFDNVKRGKNILRILKISFSKTLSKTWWLVWKIKGELNKFTYYHIIMIYASAKYLYSIKYPSYAKYPFKENLCTYLGGSVHNLSKFAYEQDYQKLLSNLF